MTKHQDIYIICDSFKDGMDENSVFLDKKSAQIGMRKYIESKGGGEACDDVDNGDVFLIRLKAKSYC
jgi:hypothetical protein